MFPIYMWVNRYKGLENFEITFDNSYKITFEDGILTINKTKTDNNIDNFYSIDKTIGNIDSVNLLIGKNGSGKTSVLEELSFIGSDFFLPKDDKILYILYNFVTNIILYKSNTNDKNFIIEIQIEGGYRTSKLIEIEKFPKDIIIKDELQKDYKDDKNYIERIGVVKFSFYEEIKSIYTRRLEFFYRQIRDIFYKTNVIHKLNIELGCGRKKYIYDYLIKMNKEKNDNFKNAKFTLLIPDLYIELRDSKRREIEEIYDLNFDEIDNFLKLYDNKNKKSFKNIIFYNYLNFIYLNFILLEIYKNPKKISKKEKLKEKKNKLLKSLDSEHSFDKKFKILYEELGKLSNFIPEKCKIIRDMANLIKNIPKKEIDIYKNREILKKFRIDCKKKNKKIIELLEKYDSFHDQNIEEVFSLFIKIEEEGVSDGERIKLQYFSTLHGVLNGEFKDREYITLLFDEVETYLHPEWSRRFLYELIEELGRYEDKKFKLILATHSPFLIADVLAKDCIYLSKNEKSEIKAEIKDDVKTFGANIIDLFKNNMFLESTFGKFATEKIKGIVDKIEKAEKYSDIKPEVDFIIGEIGEKLISNKLKSMIESKFENKDEEYYEEKIKKYQEKLKELKEKKNK